MRTALFGLLFLVLADASVRRADAWNDAGHLTVARIAWDSLNPDERAAVVAMLRHHPHCEQILLKNRPEDVSEAEWIFVRASTWADHIRPPKNLSFEQVAEHPTYRFHRGPWHYVNYPYVAGQRESDLPAKPIVGQGINSTQILEQLELSMSVLTDHTITDPGRADDVTDDQNRAIRLCWLFHLVGDLHQPLHAVTLVDHERFPGPAHSDLGGNLIMIRKYVGAKPEKLHAFWDGRLGTDSRFATIRQRAELLTHDPKLSRDHLEELGKHTHFKDWAAEGYRLAKTTAYREGTLQFAMFDDFDQHKITADDVPVLPQGAEEAANTLARRRAVLAGYRLAEKLKQIVNR